MDNLGLPYHAMLIRGPEASLDAVRVGLRDMGIEVITGPFVVDNIGQETIIRTGAKLTDMRRNEAAAEWAATKSIGDRINFQLEDGRYQERRVITHIERSREHGAVFFVEGESQPVPAWNAQMWERGAATVTRG